MKTINQQQKENKFYVYRVIHNDELVYVGRGKDDRYVHVLSGASHNKQLNELYYKCRYESTSLPQVILEYCETKHESIVLEHELIYNRKPKFNIQLKYTPPEDYVFEDEFIVDDMDLEQQDIYWE